MFNIILFISTYPVLLIIYFVLKTTINFMIICCFPYP